MINTYNIYINLTNIRSIGITNNRIVRLAAVPDVNNVVVPTASVLIENDYTIDTDQLITDITLKDKHNKISNEIKEILNNIW